MQDVDSFLAKAGLDAGVLCGCLEDLVRRRDEIKKTPLLSFAAESYFVVSIGSSSVIY
jgi:hypothetical protein